MSNPVQSVLTVLASSVVFGAAGFWLAPNQPKAAAVGSLGGAVGALGYVQNNRRLRRLESQLQQILSVGPTARPAVALTPSDLTELQQTLQSLKGQSTTSKTEIRQLRSRLDQVETQPPSKIVPPSPRLEARLSELEQRLQTLALTPTVAYRHNGDGSETTDLDLETLAEDEAAQEIIQWLNSRQVEVENYQEPDDQADALLDGLSLYLGDNYTVLSRFHWRLRGSVGRRAHFGLEHYDAREKGIHSQFLKKLKACDYLSLGRVVKNQDKPDYIIAAPYSRPDIQGFLDGGWFERYVYYKIVELLNAEVVDYQYLRNPKIIYQGSKNSELDLFFVIAGQPLVVECKTGQEFDITKFVEHRDRLGLQPHQALLVALNLPDDQAYLRSKNWGISVATPNTFLEHIKTFIPQEDGGVSVEEDAPISVAAPDSDQSIVVDTKKLDPLNPPNNADADSSDESLESFFKQRNLNLAPEYRGQVLAALSQFFTTISEPTIFNQMTKHIRDAIKEETGISRGKVNEVLNGLRYSKYFLDRNQKPVLTITQPIYSLVSTDPAVLEQVCLDFYASRIAQLIDPDYLKDPANLHEFERLTQGTWQAGRAESSAQDAATVAEISGSQDYHHDGAAAV